MTEKEIGSILTLMAVNYSKTVNGALTKLWCDFFLDCEKVTFQKACQKVMANSDYFPKVSEILTMYKTIQEQERQQQREKDKANDKRLVQQQENCFLCNNTGFCQYQREDYLYGSRCICSHGRDLNKFTKAQMYREYIPEAKPGNNARELAMIKDGKNPFYMPTIKEMLGEEFDFYNKHKKAQKLENANLKNDEDKLQMLQRLINTIG